jgi:flavoredoxin
MSIKEIRPMDLTDNVFKLIGQDWLLVSATHGGKTNGMTASWGGLGVLWARPVAYIFIRPTRYTKEFVDASGYMTLSVFEQKYKPMLQYFGTVSGRDEDKIATYALTLKEFGAHTYFEEARLTLLTKKLYAQPLDQSFFTDAAVNEQEDFPTTYYPEHDYHTMYIAEIEKVLIRE